MWGGIIRSYYNALLYPSRKRKQNVSQGCISEGLNMLKTLSASRPSAPVFRSPLHSGYPSVDACCVLGSILLVTFNPSLASKIRGHCSPAAGTPADQQQRNACFLSSSSQSLVILKNFNSSFSLFLTSSTPFLSKVPFLPGFSYFN